MIPDAPVPGVRGSPPRPPGRCGIAAPGGARLHPPLIHCGFSHVRRRARHGTLRALPPIALRGGTQRTTVHTCSPWNHETSRAGTTSSRRSSRDEPSRRDASSTSSHPSRSAPSGSSREPPWPAARTRGHRLAGRGRRRGRGRAPGQRLPGGRPAPQRPPRRARVRLRRPARLGALHHPARDARLPRRVRQLRGRLAAVGVGRRCASSTSAAATVGSSPSSCRRSSPPGAGTRSRRSRCSTRRRP